MGHMIKGFVMMMAQIIKKLLILAIIAAVACAIYFVWIKFIKTSQKHTKSAAVTRAEKQGINVKK